MENASSGVTRQILGPLHGLWAFFFGFIYYLSKGAIGWAFISFFTFNGLLIFLPLFNRRIIKGHFENNGWRETDPFQKPKT